MKFTYLNYGDNFLRKIKAEKDTVIVFSDYILKNMYLRNREKNILKEEGKILTLSEFYKEIFKTDKMILTEAKRPLTLFGVLNSELKDRLNIHTYYDIIDFADLFFKYYRELNFAMNEEIIGLQEWQKEYIEKFDILKLEYDRYLEKNNYIPNDWIESIKNYDENSLENYRKIIFVDIPYFSPLIREIIKKLDLSKDIEILMQIPEDDYDEENLKIKKVSLSKSDIKAKIYENSDTMSEIVNMIYILKNDGEKFTRDIYSPASDRNIYHKIFSKYFSSQKMNVLDNTKLYKFMKIQNNLLSSCVIKKRNGIAVEELKSALEEDIFRKIYGIDRVVLDKFYKVFSYEYKYIDKKIFEEDEIKYLFEDDDISDLKGTFVHIYDDLMEIKKFKSVEEFLIYLKKLGLENFREENYKDIIEKFYQTAVSIKTSEKLCGKKGFETFFGNNVGMSLYTLLIKYMEGIEIKEVERAENDLPLGVIKDIEASKIKMYGKSYFINIENRFIPSETKDSLIFSENQRGLNGFMTFEDRKNIEKYRFIQGIFNCDEVIIFTKKSEKDDINKSPFLEELILKYNLKIEKNPLSKDKVLEILKNSLENGDLNLEKLEKNSNKNYSLKKENRDFKDSCINLGTYDVINFRDCRYRYFLEKISEISKDEDESYGVSLRFLGIMVHKIFDEISKKVYQNIRKGDYKIDGNLVDELLEKSLNENMMKIPVYLDLYFREIMIPKIKSNIFNFYKELEKDISKDKVELFFGEKSKNENTPFYENDIKVFINGRADLLIDTEDDKHYIIDYKTGGKKGEQLDIYSIIMYGDENIACKRIYNAIKGEYEKIDKISITKKDLEELFENFVSQDEYQRAEKKSACTYCEYISICRKEVV